MLLPSYLFTSVLIYVIFLLCISLEYLNLYKYSGKRRYQAFVHIKLIDYCLVICIVYGYLLISSRYYSGRESPEGNTIILLSWNTSIGTLAF